MVRIPFELTGFGISIGEGLVLRKPDLVVLGIQPTGGNRTVGPGEKALPRAGERPGELLRQRDAGSLGPPRPPIQTPHSSGHFQLLPKPDSPHRFCRGG
jgi:hypothetical protein